MTVAGDARRTRRRPPVRQRPMDCPYCEERLENTPRGWVCPRCRSTVGAERAAGLMKESLR